MSKSRDFRYYFIDIAKGICILLVVVGHVLSESSIMSRIIYSFHMCAFFALSGILIKDHISNISLSNLFKLHSKIWISYILFSICFILYDIMQSITLKTFNIQQLVMNLFLFVSGSGIDILWFLPTLLVALVIVQTLKEKPWRLGIAISLMIVLAYYLNGQIQFQNFSGNFIDKCIYYILCELLRLFIAVPFLEFGYSLKKYVFLGYQVLEENEYFRLLALLLGCIVMSANIFFAANNGRVDIHQGLFGRNFVVFLALNSTGILGILLISLSLEKIRLIEFYGANSLLIMVVHNWFGIPQLSQYISKYFYYLPNLLIQILITIATTSGVVLVFRGRINGIIKRSSPNWIYR